MKDKKMIISTIVGVTTLVLLTIGATYAYFKVPIKNNFTKTNVSSKIESIGTVTMMPGSELNMEITSGQMMQMNKDVAYYGSSEGTKTEETSEIIGTASVNGNGVFTCTYDLVMNATGTNNMYTAVQGMNAKNGHVILTVNGVRYDFGTANLFPKTISGKIEGLTEGVNQELTAQLKLINSSGVDQSSLIGTDINITFELKNFDCQATDMGTSGAYVMKTSPANISTELVNGLYRFQGTKDEVTNNYICFGTTNKAECGAGTAFRIIGITPDGQLKIIENSGAFGQAKWNQALDNTSSWADSDLFNDLDYAINNEFDIWGDIVAEKEWKYGIISAIELDEILNTSNTRQELYNKLYAKENSLKNRINSKIGLLTFNDVYAHSDTCTIDEDCGNGWLKLSSILGTSSGIEWMMIKSGELTAYTFHSDGTSIGDTFSKTTIRPVIYLKSNLTLTGSGTITDPYMISM